MLPRSSRDGPTVDIIILNLLQGDDVEVSKHSFSHGVDAMQAWISYTELRVTSPCILETRALDPRTYPNSNGAVDTNTHRQTGYYIVFVAVLCYECTVQANQPISACL